MILLPLLLLLQPQQVPAPQVPAKQQQLAPELRRILELYYAFKDEEAKNACYEYLATHPLDLGVTERCARCLRNLGRFEDAAKTLQTLPQLPPRLKLLLAECLASTPDGVARAHQLIDDVAADDPNANEPRIARAHVHMLEGKYKDAFSDIEFARKANPKSFEAQLLSAMLQEAAGRSDEALSTYMLLVGKPTDFEIGDVHLQRDAAVGLAGCYARLQRYGEAIKIYEQLVEKCPDNAQYLLQLGICQGVREQFADSIATLEKALTLAPTDPEIRWRLADVYRSQGRTDDAIQQFEALLAGGASAGMQAVAEIRLGELYLDKGVLEKAKVHVDTAAALSPQSADVMETHGKLLERLGEFDGAKAQYRKAFEKEPLRFNAMYRLALLLAKSEVEAEKQEGTKLLDRHKRVEPFLRDVEIVKQEAILSPRSPVLMARMAGLLNLGGEYALALTWGKRAEEVNKNLPMTLIQLAYIHANLEEWSEALKYFERVQKLIGAGKLPELDDYIAKLKKGEKLPLPMGKYDRPAQRDPAANPPGNDPPAPKRDGAPGKADASPKSDGHR